MYDDETLITKDDTFLKQEGEWLFPEESPFFPFEDWPSEPVDKKTASR
jgi:hypothetical protein